MSGLSTLALTEGACLSSLGRIAGVHFLIPLFASLAPLAGRLDPCRLCCFDGKPDLLAELAEAAVMFYGSVN